MAKKQVLENRIAAITILSAMAFLSGCATGGATTATPAAAPSDMAVGKATASTTPAPSPTATPAPAATAVRAPAASVDLVHAKATFEESCSTCHASSTATAVRHDRSGWQDVIKRMEGQGLTISDDERKEVLEYLVATQS